MRLHKAAVLAVGALVTTLVLGIGVAGAVNYPPSTVATTVAPQATTTSTAAEANSATTASTAVAVVAAESNSAQGPLPFTGSDTATWLWIGVLVAATGAAFVVGARRRAARPNAHN